MSTSVGCRWLCEPVVCAAERRSSQVEHDSLLLINHPRCSTRSGLGIQPSPRARCACCRRRERWFIARPKTHRAGRINDGRVQLHRVKGGFRAGAAAKPPRSGRPSAPPVAATRRGGASPPRLLRLTRRTQNDRGIRGAQAVGAVRGPTVDSAMRASSSRAPRAAGRRGTRAASTGDRVRWSRRAHHGRSG